MIIYINGIKASQKDLEQLKKDLATGRTSARIRRTPRGNMAIITD